MTKRLLYVGDWNRGLFGAGMNVIGGGLCSLDDPGSADMAVLDRVPENAGDAFKAILTKTQRILCVPPLSLAGGDGGKFLRAAKRSGVTMTAMETPRFHPGLATVLEIVGSGVLGKNLQAVLKRRGNWPFFPVPRDGNTRSDWWDRMCLYQIGALENGRVETSEEDRFDIELILVGSTGRLCHRQWLREDGVCEWTVDSDMGANGGRTRGGHLPVELPLAIELSQGFRSPATPLTNRGVDIWTTRERKICGDAAVPSPCHGAGKMKE
ncbi:MAG: hypothetical protein RRC34_05295 [Lentisphaeria bacterium]|nr:hypothetical protein [Lentisphaeria bacterium]